MKRNIKTIAVLLVALVASIFYVHAESNPYKNLDSKEVILHYTGATLLGNSTYSKYLLCCGIQNLLQANICCRLNYLKG